MGATISVVLLLAAVGATMIGVARSMHRTSVERRAADARWRARVHAPEPCHVTILDTPRLWDWAREPTWELAELPVGEPGGDGQPHPQRDEADRRTSHASGASST